MILCEDMLELTRRMTAARSHLERLAGAYIDDEGYVNSDFCKKMTNGAHSQ